MENENLIVVIPAYEPPRGFVDYAKSVAKRSKRLVVVNDGSNSSYDEIFSEIAKLENVCYLKYDENKGKGYALKTAFRYCLEEFSHNDIIVTADCDGQHTVEDIFRVYEAARSHEGRLALGSRNFDLPNVPKRSRFGNVVTRRLFRFLYGIKLYDTQTGLRGFSVERSRDFVELKGDRFEYEMSMLIFAKRQRIEILETPIATVYGETAEEYATHFKTIADGLSVFIMLVKNLGFYFRSSWLANILDIVLFWLLTSVVFPYFHVGYTLAATVFARVCSSVLNYILNYKYVFNGHTKRSICRFYLLWFFKLGASYGIVLLFGNVIGFNLTLTKIVGDWLLAMISYQIQTYWVFAKKDEKKFYGRLARMARWVLKSFSTRYRCDVLPYDEPVVYVCRHLNMHGPYTTVKWLNFHVHPMIISPFFDEKDSYRHLKDYTFSERYGKKKRKFHLVAFGLSRVIPKVMRSLKGVPVYRKSSGAVKTFRKSMEYLLANQSLIVFPDVDYTGSYDKPSELYDGFLCLGEMYKKRTGKELRFVPIYINEKMKILEEKGSVVVNSFKEEKDAASLYLKNAINGLA